MIVPTLVWSSFGVNKNADLVTTLKSVHQSSLNNDLQIAIEVPMFIYQTRSTTLRLALLSMRLQGFNNTIDTDLSTSFATSIIR